MDGAIIPRVRVTAVTFLNAFGNLVAWAADAALEFRRAGRAANHGGWFRPAAGRLRPG